MNKILIGLILLVLVYCIVAVMMKPVIEIERVVYVEKDCIAHYQEVYEEKEDIEDLIEDYRYGRRS